MNPRLYTGYWYDRALGLYFMKARMYDPTLGRFLSPDPMLSGETALASNPYIYCDNSPLTHIDPSGKFLFLVPLLIYAPMIIMALTMIVNTPVLQASIAEDATTFANNKSTKSDKILAGIGLVATVAPIGGVGEEASSVAKAARLTKSAKAVQLAKNFTKGQVGEKASSELLGVSKNTSTYVEGLSRRMRIPDFIKDNRFVETKNVAKQSYTSQLKDLRVIAVQQGGRAELHVNPNTILSGPLQKMADEKLIDIIKIEMK